MEIMLTLLGKGKEKMRQGGVGGDRLIHKPCWEIIRKKKITGKKLESSSSKTACQYMEQLELSYTAAGNTK